MSENKSEICPPKKNLTNFWNAKLYRNIDHFPIARLSRNRTPTACRHRPVAIVLSRVPAWHLVAIRQDGEANGHIGMRKFAAAAWHILRWNNSKRWAMSYVNGLMLMIFNVHVHDSYIIYYILSYNVYVFYIYILYILMTVIKVSYVYHVLWCFMTGYRSSRSIQNGS